MFLANPCPDSIDLCSALAAQFNQWQADSRRDKTQCVLHRSRIAVPLESGGHPRDCHCELLRLCNLAPHPCQVHGTA